jgi:aspartate/methionine/tyrosine aminotransferase
MAVSPVKFNVHQGTEWVEWLYRKPARYRALGVDLFPLLISPRDEPAPHVVEASQRAAAHNVAPIDERGTEPFRSAVAGMLERELGIVVDPERELIATNGGMNATFIALAGLLQAGDEVIIPTPQFYYWNSVEIVNGVAVQVPGAGSRGWSWDIDAIEAAITPRTRVILYTNPCNPTGYAPTKDELVALGEIADRHDLVIVEDQAYEKFTHSVDAITSAASLPSLRDRTIVSYSFHKNYSLHGWRAGFLAGPAEIIEPLLSVAIWVNLRVNHITQATATAAIEGPQDWVHEMIRPYREGRNLLTEGLAGDPGITVDVPSTAGTMGYLNVSGLGLPADEAAERLMGTYGITVVPGPCFGAVAEPGEHVRIAFALARDSDRPFAAVIDALRRASGELRSR